MAEKNIIIDIMGGDHAPGEILKGVRMAEESLEGIDFTLVGDKSRCEGLLWESERVRFVDVPYIESEDFRIRRKERTSVTECASLAKGDANAAFISAGSTGAVVAESFLKMGKQTGVDRPAIAVVLPGAKSPIILLDVGANSDCRPVHFMQFAILGSVYAKIVLGCEQPRIGLLNIGTEKYKGSKLYTEVFEEFQKYPAMNFAGNVEASTMLIKDDADVVVCDGFVGNIALKSMEGISMFILNSMKAEGFGQDEVYKLKKHIDYQEYGGAMLLGVNGNVVITHGASECVAIRNAIKFASLLIDNRMLLKIKEEIQSFNKEAEEKQSE